MAKFTAGAGFGQASGSIAGITYSHNRFGPYIRTKSNPVNPNSPAQSLYRSRLGLISSSWRDLTTAQRQTWVSAASTVTLYDSLGQAYNPSGFGLYQTVNMYQLEFGASPLTVPTTPDTPPAITSLALTADTSPVTLTVAINPIPSTAYRVLVDATPVLSNGVNFISPKTYRRIRLITSSDTSPVDIISAWAAKFGSFPGNPGGQIAIRCRPVSIFGWPQAPSFARADVV